MSKKVVIAHSFIPENPSKDEADVLDQVKVVNAALLELGYDTVIYPFVSDISKVIKDLKALNPDFIFNLVETVENDGQLIHIAPSIFEHLKIPYSGCPRDAIYLTSGKIISKRILKAAGISTPEWFCADKPDENIFDQNEKYIIKAIWEHASIGLDEDSVVKVDNKEILEQLILKQSKKMNIEFFAERYIEGREFNVAILAGNILAVPEMTFVGYGDDKMKVVGYRAKWEENSYEYNNTCRVFDLPQADQNLINEMTKISLDCWKLFELKGYARVDFRVDENNKPWVLEVNTNPCISPESGYYEATKHAGMPFTQVIDRIIRNI